MGTWDTPPTPQELTSGAWDAPPTIEEVAAVSGVGAGESALRGGAQGFTAKFGDELTGLVQALPFDPFGLKPWAELASGVPREQLDQAALVDAERAALPSAAGFLDRYREARDSERRANNLARAANPKAFLAGEISGAVLGSPISGGGLARAVGTGAALGGAAGLGGSEADLTRGDVPGVLADTAKGAALGGAAGAGGQLLGRALGAALQPVARKGAELLERYGLRKGREVLTGKALAGQHLLSSQKELSDAAVRRALDEGAIRPLSTTEAAAARLEGLRGEAGEALSRVVRDLEAAGVRGPSAKQMAEELLQRVQEVEAETVASAAPKYLQRIANDLAKKFAPGERIPLQRAEALKRSLQEAARNEYKRLAGNTELGFAKMEAAAKLRGAVEDAVEQATRAAEPGSVVATLGRAFVPAKERAGQLIQASNAADFAARRMSLTPEDSLLGSVVGVATGDPVTALGAALGKSVARNRGPSTAAAAAYRASRLLGGAAERGLPGAGPRLGSAAQRALSEEEQQEALLRALRGE